MEASSSSADQMEENSGSSLEKQASSESLNRLILAKVRENLRSSKIQLWSLPYCTEDGKAVEEPLKTLAEDFSVKLNLPIPDILESLHHLQEHSLSKLAQNLKFKNEGIATLNLKMGTRSEVVNTRLDVTGEQLLDLVKAKLGSSELYCKLVCQGRFIKTDVALNEQGVGHNKTILCIVVASPGDQKKITEHERMMQSIKSTKRGAEMLAMNAESNNNVGVQILDQNGAALDIPHWENQALVVALSLHKRGQALIKKGEYKSALLFLLEADEQFSQISTPLLENVDNYAILNLDISWCYLMMKSLDALHDVQVRLAQSERFFNKSYGHNLQRLYALKGCTGEEIALFVRLYTLQGVAAFHNDNFQKASELLKKAQAYVSSLEIDDAHLSRLLSLGFESVEAKQAIRASNGNVQKAIQFAYERREKREQIKRDNEKKQERKVFQHSLGKCRNGDPVDLAAYDNMTRNLGFEANVVAEALKACNNDVGKAIQTIHSNLDGLQRAARKFSTKQGFKSLEQMGFDKTSAKAAFHHFNKDIQATIDYMLEHQGVVPEEWTEVLRSSDQSNSNTSLTTTTEEDHQAMQDLADVVKDGDNYEDILNLNMESEFIEEYLGLMRVFTVAVSQ